jgi:hypothetical protein
MSRFEDRLWDELVEQHGAVLADAPLTFTPARPRPELRRRRRPAPLAALGLALAAALTAIVIGLSSTGGTPAYAVLSNPDGTITVTIRELVGVKGADEKLASLGVPVHVVRSEAGCQVRSGEYKVPRISPELFQRISKLAGPAGSAALVITPSAIPAGDTVVIGAREPGPGAVGLQTVIYEGTTPPCLPLAG